MLGWMKHKLESRLRGEMSTTSDNADDTTLMAESEKELKSLLMIVKEERRMKIMASSPITSWHIDGETMERVTDYFWGLQNHCRW